MQNDADNACMAATIFAQITTNLARATLEELPMRPVRVEIAHGLLPGARRVFIGHREHPLDQ